MLNVQRFANVYFTLNFLCAHLLMCRLVSQIDYPSLVDLRGLLLDLVAQLLGALSRIR